MTWEDYCRAPEPTAFLVEAVRRYRASAFFRKGLEANAYFLGENPEIRRKTVLKACKLEHTDEQGRRHILPGTEDVVGNRIGNAFLFRFVCQQNQHLLQNGVSLPPGIKKQLGADFDRQLELLGEKALLQGTAWGFWNADHLEVIESVHDGLSGFFPLREELTGRVRLGVQFWQWEPQKPLYLRVFEETGVTVLKREKGRITVVSPRRPYRLKAPVGDDPGNWGVLPLIPLRANPEGRSELTDAIRAKIDAYDRILSDLADNLDRANDVYWVLNNFGGTTEDIARMLEEIRRIKAVASMGDGTGAATAEPKTIQVPYEARQAALSILRRALYEDYMALDTEAIAGGSLTNVAIRAAGANMELKCDRYEWQVFRFMQELLALLGLETDAVRFQRQMIWNESETVNAIYTARQDLDRETALKLNPMLQPEETEAMLERPQRQEA